MRANTWLLFAILVVMFIGTGLTLTWVFFPYTPLTLNALPTVDPLEAHAGNLVLVEMNYCEPENITYEVRWTIVGKFRYDLPITGGSLDSGCHVEMKAVVIPREMPPDLYRLEMDFTYHMNPLRMITVSTQTNTFRVVP